MSLPALCEGDVIGHVVKFGIDVYPRIDLGKDRTRLNMFYEEAREQFPELYDQLVASGERYAISTAFRPKGQTKGGSQQDTLVLTDRGPVFIFPLCLPDPIGSTGFDENFREKFRAVSRLFWDKLPGRKIMRIGMIRELAFSTGDLAYNAMITDQDLFSKAKFIGGTQLLGYRDDFCNVRIKTDVARITQETQLPVGTTITKEAGHAVLVHLDVNNVDPKPLQDADIDTVLTRASGLWPEELLKYLNVRVQR